MERNRREVEGIGGGRTIESQLREVEDLWEGDLISEAERNEARTRVLNQI
jgi:hypothetical protein